MARPEGFEPLMLLTVLITLNYFELVTKKLDYKLCYK